MTEDEAFIRAVVDCPGDDAARLAYADWLDERDDPRGAYLRAEFEWVKPWREGKQPGESEELRNLAAGLDPVWVARVSRPPAGVCCGHVTFTERGPVLREPDIDRLEARFGKVGAEVRAFLLNYNGGDPQPACLAYPEAAGPNWSDMDLEVAGFFRLRRTQNPEPDGSNSFGDIEDANDFLQELYEMGGHERPNPLIADMLAVAHTQHDLGYLLVGTGSKNRGRVYHFRDYCHSSDDPEHLFDFFPTVAEFLAQLRPDRDAT